jgi:mono/diheme cytochrome c family protein
MPNVDPFGQFPGDDMAPRRGVRTKATKKKSLLPTKTTAKAAVTTGKAKGAASTKGTASNKGAASKKDAGENAPLSFSQDIAPILVANCVGCHSGEGVGLRRGKLDLSTFEALKKGSQKRTEDQEIVIAGKPDDSHLVLRVKGDEEPRMPQGNNNRLSADAVARIAQWVKEGAKLDEGLDPKTLIKSYAATPEQVVRKQTAKLPPQERDKKVEATGLERWSRADPKLKPEIERGDHFIMFSNLPSDRAKAALKTMEVQYGHLKRLFGSPAMDWPEKLSLYVFANRKDFVQFVRMDDPNADADIRSSAKLSMVQPYLAIVDPALGKKEEPAAAKRRSSRSKRGDAKDAESTGADRTLAGVLSEALGTNVASTAGSPRWLSLGIGTFLAAQVERGSPYYRHLRQTAFAEFGQGWRSRASEALGATDKITAESLQAVGFALVEAIMSGWRQGFPDFVHGMLQGGDKLDDVLKEVYGVTREEFLDGTADWVASHYGQLE